MSAAGERVSLESFLLRLDAQAAAEARIAAAEIDRLARIGDAMAGIERRFLPATAVGAGLFAFGVWLFFNPWLARGWIVSACLAVLPGVALAYAWRVQPRTHADAKAERLNKAHFLPHGGWYFAPGERPAAVVQVEWTPPPPELPLSKAPRDPRKQPIRAGRIW